MENKEELKTLKGFEQDFEDLGNTFITGKGKYYSKEDLKAGVIKWVKEDEDLVKDNIIFTMSSMELFDYLQDRWMKRLNITEEDLKIKET